MRRFLHLPLLGLLLLLATPAGSSLPPHPRLIINPDRLARLRLLTHPAGDWHSWTEQQRVMHLAYRSLVRAADKLITLAPDDHWWGCPTCASDAGQGSQFQALITLSLAHLLRTGEPAYDTDKRYLTYTLDLLDNWREHDYPMWGRAHFGALNTGELLGGWALAFDWLEPEMDSTRVRNNLRALSDLMAGMDSSGYLAPILGRLDNNHLGIVYGGQGLATLAQEGHLAGAEENEREQRLAQAADSAGWYLDLAFPSGSGYEGAMYANYGMNLSLPFALATRRLSEVLAPDEQVRMPPGRGAQQAGTWLYYEQLPYNRFEASPLNDVDAPPVDLSAPFWRSWPWLLAFATPEAPSAVKQLFLTIYTPAEMAANLALPFDPDGPPDDLRGVLFSKADGLMDAGYFNPVAILLGWPEAEVPPASFVDPASLPASRAFPRRGLVIFRTGLHRLDDRGALSSDSLATMITFECRVPASFTPDGMHTGHSQFDQNQFTVFSRGQPLFWDSGYEGWPPKNGTHNTHSIQLADGTWSGFRPRATTNGKLLRWHLGLGNAPSMAAGDDSAAWNEPPGVPPLVDRSRRHFFVLPRGPGEAPYILFHDDLDYAGDTATRARWFWHSGNGPGDADFSTDVSGRTASIARGGAVALVRVLSPDTLESMQSELMGTGYWEHRVLTVQTPVRANADLVVLAAFTDHAASAISAVRLPADAPDVFAYRIVEQDRTDLAVFRRGDAHGTWTVRVDGRLFSGDASQALVRMTGADPGWENVSAGMMIAGTQIWFDHQLVAGLSAGGARGDVVFSAQQVEVTTADTTAVPGYYIGPLIPATALVNGRAQPVRLWDSPIPSWLPAAPHAARLGPPFPSPFTRQTTIPFYLRKAGPARVAIYDAQGREQVELLNGTLPAGLHAVLWKANNRNGRPVGSGIYYCTLEAGGQRERARVLVLR